MDTTDILLVTSGADHRAVKFIEERTGLEFPEILDPHKGGGRRATLYSCHSWSSNCLMPEEIKEVVDAFKEAPWRYPKFAGIFINDDYTRETAAILMQPKSWDIY